MAARVMERPKQRRIVLVALALLAAGALLLSRQRTSEPEHTVVQAELPRTRAAELQHPTPEPTRIEANVSNAPALPPATAAAPATGFRGRVIDAVTRQPLPEFEVRLTPV